MKKLTSSKKKQAVENYKKIFKRINFNGGLYFNILKKNLDEYIKHEKQVEKEHKKGAVFSILGGNKFRYKMQHNEVVVIAFAAMFLECIIWDYAAVNTSQTFAEHALGKIDLVAKWKVIPKLINDNKKIEIDGKAISLLKTLVQERNLLVHSKSKALSDNYEEVIDYISTHSEGRRKITAKEAHQCVIDCTEELKKIDTTDYWFFQNAIWDSYKNSL